MITTKILNENDIKNLVTNFFAEQGLTVASFEINLTSRCMDRFGQSDEHIFDNITVTVEEKPGLETFSQDLTAQKLTDQAENVITNLNN